jgi:hypothetical protein
LRVIWSARASRVRQLAASACGGVKVCSARVLWVEPGHGEPMTLVAGDGFRADLLSRAGEAGMRIPRCARAAARQ